MLETNKNVAQFAGKWNNLYLQIVETGTNVKIVRTGTEVTVDDNSAVRCGYVLWLTQRSADMLLSGKVP